MTCWLDSLDVVDDGPALQEDTQYDLSSLATVFAINQGALRRYQGHGYNIVERRSTVAFDWQPTGDLLLLSRTTVID